MGNLTVGVIRYRKLLRSVQEESSNRRKISQSGTDVMIFKNIFAKKFSKKMAFFTQNKAKLCKIMIVALVF
jgi:hypothetical protein